MLSNLPPALLFALGCAVLVALGLAVALLRTRRALRGYREREQEYLTLAESANAAVFIIDGERYRYLNPYTEQLSGRPRAELYAHPYWTYMLPEFATAIRAQLAACRDGEAIAQNSELAAVAPDGTDIWIAYAVTAVNRGGQMFILGTCHDVTARKRAEAGLQRLNAELEQRVTERTDALRVSEAENRHFLDELRALIDLRNELLFLNDPDALCRRAVELGHARLGFDRLSLWFAGAADLLSVSGSFGIDEHGALRDERRQLLEVHPLSVMGRAILEATTQIETATDLYNDRGESIGQGVHAVAPLWDGHRVVGCLSVDNLISGQPFSARQLELLNHFAVAIGYLVTLKRTEQALRVAHEELEAVINASPLAIVTLDAAGRIQSWNPAAGRMFCLTADEVLGQYPPPVKPHQLARYQQLMGRVRQGETVTGYEAIANLKDGSELPISVSCAPLRDADGVVTGIMTVMADISAQRRNEADIRRYQEELRALAAEVLATEERERRRLAQEIHDSISQTLALAKLRLGSLRATQDNAVRDELGDISRLLDQVIQRTRSLTFELSPPILHELGLEAAIEWLAEDLQRQYGVHITVEYGERTRELSEEMRAFFFMATREVLINVVKHAHATEAGVRMRHNGTALTISVRDDGAGFDPAQLSGPGIEPSGYGLFSIRERLRYLGGRFDIESAPGDGTTVTLHAPFAVARGKREPV